MNTVLAIHAHPDDVETLAGGTLALLASKGHRVVIATLTAGDCGSAEHDRDQTARIRLGEAAKAAAVIGAEHWCGGFGDLAVFNDDSSRRRVTELVRAARPTVVITSAAADYHPDHEATSVLVRDACFAAPAPNFVAGPSAPVETIPHLYFMDPIGGRDRDGKPVAPGFAVNIGAFIGTKREMLAAHQSQAAWLLKQHGVADFAAAMESLSRRRGRDFGVAFAEGFRQYRHEPYPRGGVLQDMVGEALLRPAALGEML